MKWPIYTGNYLFGEVDNPICINCLGSKLTDIAKDYFSILGSCMTENLGIEKIVANIVTNPNIRYVILCGEEVQGHKPGLSFLALHKNGLDENSKIIDSPGAIPYIENVPKEVIHEFQQQVEVIDLIGVTDINVIVGRAKELLGRDNEKYESKIDLESIFSDKKQSKNDEFVSTNDVLLTLSKVEHKLAVLSSMESSKVSFNMFISIFTVFLTLLTLLAIV